MSNHIFISYSKKDSQFAHKLADDLNAAGHKIWIDRSLQVGDDWEKTIEQELENAQEVIVILSKNSIASKWVQHEGSIAYGLKKTIFPVLLDTLPPDDLPLWSAKFQYHNFVGVNYQIAFDALNTILTPPNPIQDLLDQQVNAYKQTGALMSEAILGVIEESQDTLEFNEEAEKLIQASLEKRQQELSEREKHRQREIKQNKRVRQSVFWLAGLLAVVLFLLGFVFKQNRISKANNLASQALRANDNHQYQLAALLGLESKKIYETEEANNLLAQIPYFETPFGVVLQNFSHGVNSMAWSKDGQLAVSFRWHPSVVVWDSKSNQLHQLIYHEGVGVRSVAWSVDGQLASGGYDDTIIIWDLETNKPRQILQGHMESVSSVAWSVDGYLASGGADGSVIVWDLETGKPYQIMKEAHSVGGYWTTSGTSVAWSADGRLASGGFDDTVIIWDLETGQPEQILQGHGDNITSIAWSTDGQLASSAGGFGDEDNVIVWNLETGEPYQILRSPNSRIDSVAWSVDGLLASDGEGVTIWDIKAGEPDQIFQSPMGDITSIAWSTDGQLTSASVANATGSGPDSNSIVVVWDFETGNQNQLLESHRGPVQEVAVSVDGQLASSGSDGTVIIWNLESGQPSQVLRCHESGVVASVAWSLDGRLASGGHDGSIIVWNLETGEPLEVLPGHEWGVNSVAWSMDGQLASGGSDGSVIIWNLATGQPHQVMQGQDYTSISWSLDGQLVSGVNGEVVIWDLGTGKPYKILENSDMSIYSLAWSTVGKLASIGTKVAIWDLDTGRPHQILGGYGFSIVWLPDGRLVIGQKNGLIRIVPDRYLNPICEWVGRNLTEREWERYIEDLFYRRTCSNLPWPNLSFSNELAAYFRYTSFLNKNLFILVAIFVLSIPVLVSWGVFKFGKAIVLRIMRRKKKYS